MTQKLIFPRQMEFNQCNIIAGLPGKANNSPLFVLSQVMIALFCQFYLESLFISILARKLSVKGFFPTNLLSRRFSN